MEKITKIQTGQISIDKDAVAGIKEVKICTLYQGYNKIKKIEAFQIHASGQSYSRLGIKDDSGELIGLVHINSFLADAGVSPDMKGKSVVFRARNQDLYAIVQLPGNNDTTNNYVIDFAIHLENDPEFNPTSC